MTQHLSGGRCVLPCWRRSRGNPWDHHPGRGRGTGKENRLKNAASLLVLIRKLMPMHAENSENMAKDKEQKPPLTLPHQIRPQLTF